MLITADHGNAEMLIDPVTGGPHTAHTTNPVPFIVISDNSKQFTLKPGGSLQDISPTILGYAANRPTKRDDRTGSAANASVGAGVLVRALRLDPYPRRSAKPFILTATVTPDDNYPPQSLRDSPALSRGKKGSPAQSWPASKLGFEGAPFDCDFLPRLAPAAEQVTTTFSRRRNQ